MQRTDPAQLREREVHEIRGSHAKLTRATGWAPEIPLERTLADTLDWWRERVGAGSPAEQPDAPTAAASNASICFSTSVARVCAGAPAAGTTPAMLASAASRSQRGAQPSRSRALEESSRR